MLYKRSSKPGSHWWVRFSIKGNEIRQSSGTDSKDRAEAFERELRNAVWDEENLGIESHTWEEACERWLREKAHKRSLDRDRGAIRRLAIWGDLDRFKEWDCQDRCGARELAVLRSILNACVRWNWLDKAPKVEMPHEEKHDPRWITKAQFAKLCKELPPHAAAIARFAVATGLRQANIFGLKWENVSRRSVTLHSRETKTRQAQSVPLNADSQAVLKGQSGLHREFVFTDHRGRAPVASIKTTWLKATKRAGLEGFRFHDLRHTWAAWHVLAGTPPIILKELGGWSSLAMVERYGHLNPSHLSDWADNSSIGGSKRKRKRGRKKS